MLMRLQRCVFCTFSDFCVQRVVVTQSKSLCAMSDMDEQEACKAMFLDVVHDMCLNKGKRPSAKEVANETGLDIEDAKMLLSEVPPVKKQKKAATPATASTEPPPAEVAAAAEPAGSAEPAQPVAEDVGEDQPDLEETQLDEIPEELKKEEPKLETPKAELDAKSEAATQRYPDAHSPAPSPAELKQQSNKDALQLVRPSSQR